MDDLASAVARCGNGVCVGLDPRMGQLPKGLLRGGDSLAEQAGVFRTFCRGVIDVVGPLVPVVKPQSAFFEMCGPAGMVALQRVLHRARIAGVIGILDSKRGDIA